MVAVDILDVKDRVHFVDFALGRDHPIRNIEVVCKAPEEHSRHQCIVCCWK